MYASPIYIYCDGVSSQFASIVLFLQRLHTTLCTYHIHVHAHVCIGRIFRMTLTGTTIAFRFIIVLYNRYAIMIIPVN